MFQDECQSSPHITKKCTDGSIVSLYSPFLDKVSLAMTKVKKNYPKRQKKHVTKDPLLSDTSDGEVMCLGQQNKEGNGVLESQINTQPISSEEQGNSDDARIFEIIGGFWFFILKHQLVSSFLHSNWNKSNSRQIPFPLDISFCTDAQTNHSYVGVKTFLEISELVIFGYRIPTRSFPEV